MRLFLTPSNMVISSISTRKASGDILGVWVSLDTLGVVSTFFYGDAFTLAMTEVGPPED